MAAEDNTAGSTSNQPLVPQTNRKRRQQSWFHKHITEPWQSFNFLEALFVRPKPRSPARSIYINTPLPSEFFDSKGRIVKSKKYYSNQNVTSKYTLITFLPRNLLEQFRRVANIFFLAINILQFFPKFSTISPGLVILPLLVVLAITAGKDAYEDVKRHQADRRVNNSVVHILRGEGYENLNPMKAKSKTFVPKLPLPHRKSKKGKKAAAEAEAQVKKRLQGGATDEAPEARPSGHADLERTRTQVSTWDDDPEAGDRPGELGWHRTVWEDVKVGDIVKIYDHEQFPADMVICATSEEEDVAYIETKNLDGETNLKSRHGVTGLKYMNSAEACRDAHLRIDLDRPEHNMFRLNGAITNLDEEQAGEHEIHPITLETTLLRGCVLKNTAWVIGIVIFTGHDTKIVQNSGATPSKRSKVERSMDPMVLVNLLILALVAMVCAIVDHFNEVRWYAQDTYWTLYDNRSGDNPNINGLVTFANAFITFQNIVPISLYISIEFVRTCQAAFIYWDHAIKYVKNGVTTRTTARSWNLSDDLGQIEYIFSDKTGTLTQNAMIFRQCSVGGIVYTGDGQTPENTLVDGKGGKQWNTSSDSSSSQEQNSPGDINDNGEIKVALPKEVLAPFHDAQLIQDLRNQEGGQARILHGFFAVLALCHTVLASEDEHGVLQYKAQSPDEAALVQSAADVGFIFRGRDHNIMKLKTPFNDECDEYELLHLLEFNSARKRMSVLIRKLDEEGRIFLLCKGADNVVFERLGEENAQTEFRQKTDQDLQFFASEGLRTLCLAYKIVDPMDYEKWAAAYHEASVSLDQREEKIEQVSDGMERGLTLLGATAIEDKLQDGVPEAISDLKRAGIKVWVATGDKLETAVAIGYTTHLLTPETNLIIIREGNHSVHDQLRDSLDGFFGDGHHMDPELRRSMSHHSPNDTLHRVNTGARSLVGADNGQRPGGFSLVIDGHALAHAFGDPDTNDLLLALSTKCNTVICCRVSPLQKAQIVHLIKDNLGVMCLAIGDGANDVSMIQAADVGVGISGEEGLQAVNSSDYAIAQFRYLNRLLFVHGHWSYFRNSNMILNFFYKNIIGIGVLFWFQIYCGWSTTYVFAYVYLLFWNVFWTLLPVIAIGLFDRHIDAVTLMALPELYRFGREQTYFKLRRFTYYMLEGLVQSAVVYFILNYTYLTTTTRGDGWDVYIYEMSTTMAIAAVMVANLFSGLNIESWNWWVVFGTLLGPALIWIFTAVYSVIKPSSFYTGVYGNDIFLFRSAAFWFGWPFVTVMALLPRFFIRAIKQNYLPNDIDTMRLVRAYQPDIDPFTHPLLGGKLMGKATGKTSSQEEEEPFVPTTPGIPMRDISGGIAEEGGGYHQEPDYSPGNSPGNSPRMGMGRPRTSMQSTRLGMHAAGRGSQVDMSTGLRQQPSRGFDFAVEEGGVAVARMQSRLSEASSNHRSRGFKGLRPLNVTPSNPFASSQFGIAKIRERAGSVFSPKKRDRRNTTATQKSTATGATDDTNPNPNELSPAIATGSTAADPISPARHRLFRGGEDAGTTERRESVRSRLGSAGQERSYEEKKDGGGDDPDLGGGFGTGRVMAPPMEPRS